MPIPPGFAPDIKLRGFEEARFAPGMFDTGSSNYFTYALAVVVDGTGATDAAGLKDFLDKYYKGLSVAVGRRKQIAPDTSKINAVVDPAPADAGAGSRYRARVIFLDTFNDGREIGLNMEIRVMARPPAGKTLITLLISPQPPGAGVWKRLREIEGTIRADEA